MSSIPCNNCRRSKKKCNREKPCSRCKLQSVECIYNEVNLYKRGGTAKVAKLLDRAQNLQILLEKAVRNDIKHHCFDVNKIINYWNDIKLEMTDYKDLNLPLAVAWFQIEDSLPVIVSKYPTLVKSPSNYQDAVTLLNIYITYLHPVYPFISPKKLHLLLQHSKFDNPLLTSTLCRAQIFWFAINNYNIPNLEEIELYRISISNAILNETTVSLDMIQAYINLILLELHQRQPIAASKHLTQAVYKSHQLDLHNTVPSPLNPDTEEKRCAWSLLSYLDFLCVLFLRQSPLIRVDPNLNMNTYSGSALKYDKDKIFQNVSYEIMSQYEACVKLSWDFPKIKRDFKPQKASELTALHLIEILTRVQTFVNLNVDEDQLKLVNSVASSAQLGNLSIYVKCGMLIIDLCEVLASYYIEQPEIRTKYRETQRECSTNLIECLFPQLIHCQSNSKNLEFFDFIDPIFPQGAFHACKILLEDIVSIPDNYFGLSYKHCVNSTKLFKCNWLMMKYFERFKEHPYLIHLNSELEAEHCYLTPNHSSSSAYSSLLTSSSI